MNAFKGGTSATCAPYIDARHIQERLDSVCGPGRWRNEYQFAQDGAGRQLYLCGISILVSEEVGWVTKWDGAGETEFEPGKGGLSDSLRRAAVQWGIGRYLYGWGEQWAIISVDGEHYQKCKEHPNGHFRWSPPGKIKKRPDPPPKKNTDADFQKAMSAINNIPAAQDPATWLKGIYDRILTRREQGVFSNEQAEKLLDALEAATVRAKMVAEKAAVGENPGQGTLEEWAGQALEGAA